jgi:hypothetical protein
MSNETIKFSERNPEKDPYKEFDIRARAKMSANSALKYGDAIKAVRYEDPELTRAWLDGTPHSSRK